MSVSAFSFTPVASISVIMVMFVVLSVYRFVPLFVDYSSKIWI